MSTLKQKVESDLKKLKQMESAKNREEQRIVKEFLVLLLWLEGNLPDLVSLPFGCLIRNGVFYATGGSEQDRMRINLSTKFLQLKKPDMLALVRFATNGFVKELKKNIRAETKNFRPEISRLKKVSIPTSL
jgi:hypothetical protein